MFCVGRTGNPAGMQPYTSTEPLPIAQVSVGMVVLDSIGTEAGTVNAIQLPGTDVRPDAAAGLAEHLMATGYLRIDGSVFVENDLYAAGDEIAAVEIDDVEGEPGVVQLRVQRDELPRADD
jgi:hypothetical protein